MESIIHFLVRLFFRALAYIAVLALLCLCLLLHGCDTPQTTTQPAPVIITKPCPIESRKGTKILQFDTLHHTVIKDTLL